MESWLHQNKPTGTNRHQWITPTSTQLFDVTENRVQKTLFNRQGIDLGGWVGEANQRSHGHQHKSSGSTENFGHQGATWRAQVAIWPCNDVCGEESEHHQLLHVSSFQSMVGVSKILDPGPKHSLKHQYMILRYTTFLAQVLLLQSVTDVQLTSVIVAYDKKKILQRQLEVNPSMTPRQGLPCDGFSNNLTIVRKFLAIWRNQCTFSQMFLTDFIHEPVSVQQTFGNITYSN